MFALHQTVRVTRDVPSKHVTRGMVGAVVVLHERSYEVEFVNPDGSTALQVVLFTEEVESAEDLRVLRERDATQPSSR